MIALLLSAPYLPFAIAFVVMVGIGLIEAIGLGLGHVDLDGPGVAADGHGGLLDWLGLGGELPILIWLTSLLGCFTLAGIVVQQGATALTGAPLHAGLASAVALVAGGFANVFASRGLARIMPGYESSVVSTDELLRLRGRVLEGTARRGHPARAKVVDRHGQAHFIMVEPHEDGDALAAGAEALIVRRDGSLFFAIPDTHKLLQTV